MNRRELVETLATQADVDKKVADNMLRSFVDVVCATVAKGDPVAISGFCKFEKRRTAARMGRNPQTGEPVKIPARTKARITPLKGFKDIVLGTAAAPKLRKATAAPAKAGASKSGMAPMTKAAAKKAPAKKGGAKKATAKKAAAKR